jgi:negative regulator of flagellin synthesis FlgM
MDVTKVTDNKIAGAKSQESSGIKNKGQVSGEAKTTTANPLEGAKSGNEKVAWSQDAELFSSAVASAQQAPDARTERVNELKARIQRGDYQIDSKALADQMIQKSFEDDLLSRKS